MICSIYKTPVQLFLLSIKIIHCPCYDLKKFGQELINNKISVAIKRSRRNYTAKFKAKLALEAIKEQKSLSKLSEQFKLHP